MPATKTIIIIPNWNGADSLGQALGSLAQQSQPAEIVVVDNGSIDKSIDLIEADFPAVTILAQPRNLGFAGGVNVGLQYALEQEADFIALFNNDAKADKEWLKHLLNGLKADDKLGIVTGKLLSADGKSLDSTGEAYSIWGLPFPRGRGETDLDKYDQQTEIFAATGGASLYRAKMLQQIGLFDESFFAYYEDVDLSFRAQLAGWRIKYEPKAKAYHQIGATSSKIKGFTTYQALKNLPQLNRKNVPGRLVPKVLPRFVLAYWLFVFRALGRGHIGPALKGVFMAMVYIPKNIAQRIKIQTNRQVSVDYINKLFTHDLPPKPNGLRKLRAGWWRLIGKDKNG